MKAKQAEIELEQKLLRETAELTKVHVCELGNLIDRCFVLTCYQNNKTHYNTIDVHMHAPTRYMCLHTITFSLHIWIIAARTNI